jgi:hypothetical protein
MSGGREPEFARRFSRRSAGNAIIALLSDFGGREPM